MSDQLSNDRLLRALLRQPLDRTPVWIMRQAGRYLPEYRAVREQAGDFMTLCKTPELACQVTLQPLDRYPLDAAILFSDILTIPDAMGLGLYFTEGEGPHFEHPVRSESDISTLAVPDPDTELRYVMDAVALIRRELAGRVPLIGFAGSPWTLATYMVEGKPSKNFARIKELAYRNPASLHALLDVTAQSVAVYLNAQIAHGAEAVMMFDTWGGVLTPRAFEEFSLNYMTRIVSDLTRQQGGQRIPVILFTKGGGAWLEKMLDARADALGVDWTIDLQQARARVGDHVALQGNLDPAALYAEPDRIRDEVGRVLSSFGHGSGHVFNLGHGISPDVQPDHVKAMVDAVHELSPAYHTAS